MTNEEKQLLLIDLCARLPYGVRVLVQSHKGTFCGTLVTVTTKLSCTLGEAWIEETDEALWCDYSLFKPYLRPMSSMTEEEGKELEHLLCEIDAPCWVDTEYGCVNFTGGNDFIDTEIAEVYTDWLNRKMFDYRGLIPMGLALEAPKDMYKF